MVADLLTKPLPKDIFKELKYKLLYGFGGNAENISRHFTPIEQVYKEIDLHDAVLAAQVKTRINLIKTSHPKEFASVKMKIFLVKNMLMIYSSVEFNS